MLGNQLPVEPVEKGKKDIIGTHQGKLTPEARAVRAAKNQRNRSRRGLKDRPRKDKY